MAEAPKTATTLGIVAMKAKGERIVMLTCYDALFARLLDASVDILLVGDSVNEVLAGQPSTLSATLDQMIYHTTTVRRGAQHALVVCDMPFLTYQVSTEEAIRNCGRVMAQTGCHAVKLEGGRPVAATVRALVDVGDAPVGGDEEHIEGDQRVLHPEGGGTRAAEIEEHAGIGGECAAEHQALRLLLGCRRELDGKAPRAALGVDDEWRGLDLGERRRGQGRQHEDDCHESAAHRLIPPMRCARF